MPPVSANIASQLWFAVAAIALALNVAALVVLAILLRRSGAAPHEQARTLREAQERMLRAVREEVEYARDDTLASDRHTRQEMLKALFTFSDAVQRQLATLTQSTEVRSDKIRETVDARLRLMQEENADKLEQMRQTVDEKLQGTLERRLGESFRQVSERLEEVHAGLGEMRTLAGSVGDLKRVLTNVKTRGTWGEVQLGALLEQLLTPEQYAANVVTGEATTERVEFAIRLPGREGLDGDPVWLPIDAKFPQEDYLRLLEAQDRSEPIAVEAAVRGIEVRIKNSARDICDKYLNPPRSTDFGIMYLPTEGLYAEVVRRTGLLEVIQRECRVIVAGPTTLAALLNALQMGFRTLAIEKRSSEVWKLLGAVKTEFGKFGDLLENVQKKLQTASMTIEDAARKSRTIERKLRGVQEIPSRADIQAMLIGAGDGDREGDRNGDRKIRLVEPEDVDYDT